MVAWSFIPYTADLPHVVIFASGVSDSNTTDLAAYEREIDLLQMTLSSYQHVYPQKQIVYFSSGGAIYGSVDYVRNENTPAQPSTLHGHHQFLCENLIVTNGLNYLIVRLPNIIGIRQNPNQLIPVLIQQAQSGKANLFRHATRDLIDITDITNLTIKLLRKLIINETVIIASGISHMIHDIFKHVQALLNTDAKITFLEKGSPQRFDITKLRSLLEESIQFNDDYLNQILRKYVKVGI